MQAKSQDVKCVECGWKMDRWVMRPPLGALCLDCWEGKTVSLFLSADGDVGACVHVGRQRLRLEDPEVLGMRGRKVRDLLPVVVREAARLRRLGEDTDAKNDG